MISLCGRDIRYSAISVLHLTVFFFTIPEGHTTAITGENFEHNASLICLGLNF